MATVRQVNNREIRALELLPQFAVVQSAMHAVRNSRKLSGQFRNNFRMAVNRVDASVRFVFPYRPNAITNELAQRHRAFTRISKSVKLGDVVWISNNLHYGPFLNYQKGDLFMEKAIARWQQHNERAWRQARRRAGIL